MPDLLYSFIIHDVFLQKIKNMLPSEPNVKAFMLDFEAAAWKEVREVFPGANITGCTLHWTQAVWKKVQAVAKYEEGGGIQRVIRRLLALPLQPSNHIPVVFEAEKNKLLDHDALSTLYQYVENQWITGSMWSPQDWSCQ